MPGQLIIFFIAMLPVVELRGAIPSAVLIYHLPWWQAYLLSIAGNMVPAIFLVYFLRLVSEYLAKKSVTADRFFRWWFSHTKKKFNNHYEKYGAAALAVFVAVPLPVTGVWTASVAAYLLGIRPKIALTAMFLGVLLAGILVSIITFGVNFFVL